MCILNFGVKFCILLIFCVVVILDGWKYIWWMFMYGIIGKNWNFFLLKFVVYYGGEY